MSPLQEFEQAKADFAAEVSRVALGPGWRGNKWQLVDLSEEQN